MLDVLDLCKTYTGVHEGGPAVNSISFNLKEGELFTLLGPSGCGKSTTLRAIAGLERPDSGEIKVAGTTIFSSVDGIDVPVDRRGLGMVFQSYAIWPHMTVLENVAFPLRARHGGKRFRSREAEKKALAALEVVELGSLASRRAPQLSGGQQQRLALARALALEPRLLLLDEPLSNLDARLRDSMRLELKRLQRDLGVTTVYVTHDQVEALELSNRIAVMNGGRIAQVGTPRDIYDTPTSAFVASFVGRTNLLEGVLENRAGDDIVVTDVGRLRLAAGERTTSRSVWVSVRPESIDLRRVDGANLNGNAYGKVVSRGFNGEAMTYLVECGGREIQASLRSSDIHVGEEVQLVIPRDCVRVMAREAGDDGEVGTSTGVHA